ncbi:hypothetical protein [Actinomadura sp. WMMA1423]|uniref:hypothetical protein n=1 Tax=Actinomadura sp. WMMA1423 TaxID=2591108 RepID=UPI0011465BE3|nr:hypothetical protein [Actinomadura sp. WMMA1423]
MSQTGGIAQFVRQPSDLAECRAGVAMFDRDELQAFLASVTDLDAAMAELTASFEEGDVYRAGMMAFVCGMLVGRSGSVTVPVDAVLRLMERHLHLAKDFAGKGGVDAEDDLFRVSPDLVRAHYALPFVLLATMRSRRSRTRRGTARLRRGTGCARRAGCRCTPALT